MNDAWWEGQEEEPEYWFYRTTYRCTGCGSKRTESFRRNDPRPEDPALRGETKECTCLLCQGGVKVAKVGKPRRDSYRDKLKLSSS